MSRFYFKNLKSGEGHFSDEFGIYLRSIPIIPVTKREYESHPVEGRDGTLTIDKKRYRDLSFPLDLIVSKKRNDELYEQLDAIYNWMDGRGELSFEEYLPGKHFITKIIELGDFEHVAKAGGFHTIGLLCEPFKYSELKKIEFVGPKTIFNPSELESKPDITIYGTGNITISVNGVSTILNNVNEYVTIESEAQRTRKDLTPKNSDKIGPFPILKKGANLIETTGTVTNIKLETKWRYK